MIENLLTLNWLVSVGALFLEIFVGVLILFIIYFKSLDTSGQELLKDKLQKCLDLKKSFLNLFYLNIKYDIRNIENIVLIKIFILSLFSSVMTLVYSEYFGVIPCALCWFERVFMYGTMIISGTALFARNQLEQVGILRYLAIFSVSGAIVSLYHHILQMTAGVSSHLPCPASGGDCAKRVIFEFGHITFPWLAFIVFVLFLVMIYISKLFRTK